MADELPVHPAAHAFPMHGEDDLNRLAVDIAQNGLKHPIVLTKDGQVLDGRNRLTACRLVNVEPEFVVYEDDDLWEYSRAVNINVRTMSTGQKVAACALSLIAQGKRKDGRWEYGSVPAADGETYKSVKSDWPVRMAQIGFVADWSDDLDLVHGVRDGRIALDAAHKQAKARKDKADFEEAQAAKQREREIAANDAELARLMEYGHAQINLNFELIGQAEDVDNWKGVVNLAPKVIAIWTRMKEEAHAHLED